MCNFIDNLYQASRTCGLSRMHIIMAMALSRHIQSMDVHDVRGPCHCQMIQKHMHLGESLYIQVQISSL